MGSAERPLGKGKPIVAGRSGRTVTTGESRLENAVGIYTSAQASTEPPSYFVERSAARQWKQDGRGFFINHGKDFRLLAERDVEAGERNGTADSWEEVSRSRIPFRMAQQLGIRGSFLTVTTKQFEPDGLRRRRSHGK